MYLDRGAFEPRDGAIEVSFVKGNEGFSSIPEVIALSGLNERFAVIQETAVEGCNDWYFDKLLWRCLVKYVLGQGGQVTVVDKWLGKDEVPFGEYSEAWEQIDPQHQEPPWVIFVRVDGRLILSMVTEYWCLAGGDPPYSDSYTYSFFTHADVGKEIILAIKNSPSARRWTLQQEILQISPEDSKMSPVSRHPMPPLLPLLGMIFFLLCILWIALLGALLAVRLISTLHPNAR